MLLDWALQCLTTNMVYAVLPAARNPYACRPLRISGIPCKNFPPESLTIILLNSSLTVHHCYSSVLSGSVWYTPLLSTAI